MVFPRTDRLNNNVWMQSESQETSKTTPTPAQLAQQEATSLSFNWSIADTLSIVLLTALTFATRFYKLDEPRFTLFDEVHFGKFVFQLPTPPSSTHLIRDSGNILNCSDFHLFVVENLPDLRTIISPTPITLTSIHHW